MDKMIMAVIDTNQAEPILDALITNGFPATFFEAKGGFLCQSQYSIFIPVPENKVVEVCRIIETEYKKNKENIQDQISTQELSDDSGFQLPEGAKIYVWNLDQQFLFN